MTTREKLLKPATIIPGALYVERSADRQLRSVIEDMGRPGYVLVARQMGKTNLLLHARGTLERQGDVFVYLDFSLPAESLREQLRSIIDSVIRLRPKIFSNAGTQIANARRTEKLPAHKEYENELRALLEACPGKIVLIFDEIDALTNSSYSDQLFSLVRSMYFSRANFPEYGRLTYVLSGVAEPSDLIKNKNISPFNIGEKIYLDEFTREETKAFLSKARLELSEGVVDHLFAWTSGNPRITWDVCSALEDEVIARREVSVATVDAAVQRLYFGSVDRAPIDHIRTIVGDQREIREAIRKIRLKDGQVGDQMRAKLYLAGIISSTFDAAAPSLKNKIIDLALSPAWLEDVERRKHNALELARERTKNKQYKEALQLFLEHLASVPEKEDKSYLYYEIGVCHFEEERYQEAKEWFQKQPIDPQVSLLAHLHELYYVGLCDTYLEKYAEAVGSFQKVIDAERQDAFYLQSLVNQAAARVLMRNEGNLMAAEEALRKVLANEANLRTQMPEDEARKVLMSARVNLGRVLEQTGRNEQAIAQFETALEQCMDDEKPTILTSLIGLEKTPEKKALRTSEARKFVTSYKPALAKRTASNPLAFDYLSMVQLYSQVAAFEQPPERRSFGEYVRRQYFNDQNRDTQFTFDVALTASTTGNMEIARGELTEYLSRAGAAAPDNIQATALKLILFRNRRPDSVGLRSRYLEILEKKPYAQLDSYDFGILVDHVGDLFGRSRYVDALKILSLANAFRATTPPEAQVHFIVLDYFQMIISAQVGEIETAKGIANRLKSLDVDATIKTGRIAADDARMIKAQATDMAGGFERRTPAKNPYLGIGRNEMVTVKYTDGRVLSDKFKRVKVDLDQGKCQLVGRAGTTVT